VEIRMWGRNGKKDHYEDVKFRRRRRPPKQTEEVERIR